MKKIIIIFLLLLCLNNFLILGQRTKTFDTIPKISKLDTFINTWIGKPYSYGGTSINGIDCSAFVQKFYYEIFDITLPRTAHSQYKSSVKIPKEKIDVGDLLFFISPNSPSRWHVAVYLGNNMMAHASNKKRGVVVDKMTQSLIKNIYAVGRFN
jgi:probable lipoprotein NlpC